MYNRPLSSEQQQRVAPMLRHILNWILLIDPPQHERLRRLVNLRLRRASWRA
jgi:cytochrome P450